MKQNMNPVTLLSMKEGARIENTLFKAIKGEVMPVKFTTLLKRNFSFETFFSKFLRSCSFEVLRIASCERLYNKASLSKVKGKAQFTQKVTLEPWLVSNKTIIEVENITKAAIFRSFLHLSYKNTELLFLWQCLLIFSWDRH